MNNGNLSRNVFWFLCLCVCSLASVQEVSAAHLRFTNDSGASFTFSTYVNGTLLRSDNLTTGTSFERSFTRGQIEAIATAPFTFTCTAGIGGTNLYTTDGVTSKGPYTGPDLDVVGFKVPAAPHFWSSTGSGAPPCFSFAGTIKNSTAVARQYKVYHNAPGEEATVVGQFFLSPGATASYTVENQEEKGFITVEETPVTESVYLGDGMWSQPATGSFTFVADDTSAGWVPCGDAPNSQTAEQTPVDIGNIATNAVAMPQTTSTNPVTQADYAKGVNGLAAILQGMNDRQAQSDARIEGALTNQPNEVTADTNDAPLPGLSDVLAAAGTEVGAFSNAVGGVISSVSSMTNFDTGPAKVDAFWTVGLPALAQVGGGPSEIDFDPTVQGGWLSVAAWTRNLLAWLSLVMLLAWMFQQVQDMIKAQGSFPVGFTVPTAKSASALPTNKGNLVKFVVSKIFAHAAIFLIVAFVLTSITAIFTTYIISSGMVTSALVNPWSSGYQPIVQGMWMVSQFVPLDVFIFHFVTGLIFRAALAVYALGVQLALRAVPACIVFGFLTFDVNAAANFSIANHYGTNVYLQAAPFGYLQLNQSDRLDLNEYDGSDLNVYDLPGGSQLGVISNLWTTADADVFVWLGQDSGASLTVSWFERMTVHQAFYEGAKVGGFLFSLAGVVWLARLLRGNAPGEGATG